MEEDVLGPREEAIGDRYTTCGRCGTVIPIKDSTLVSMEGLGVATEQLELCPECKRQLDSGEADWEIPETDDAL